MKILVCGKGGSGKSTVSALLAREIARRGEEVLVVDTDESNFGLYKQLGFDRPRDFMEHLGGKSALSERLMKFLRSGGQERLRIMDETSLDDLPGDLLVGEDGIRLLAIGKIQGFGEGCACPMGALAREFLEKIRTDGHIVVDTDAGIEHFGRGVEAGCDRIVVVVDPSFESVQLSGRISELGEAIGKPVYFILNRMDESSLELLDMVDRSRVIGALPFDRGVFKACLKGERVPDLKEMGLIAERLLAS